MTLDTRYTVIRALEIPQPVVVDYWQRLKDNDLLRSRLCDVKNPGTGDVIAMLKSPLGATMFNVVDLNKPARLVAEFALTNFTGKAAMIHFSMSPDNSPQTSMHIAREVTNQVLNDWHDLGDSTVPYLYSLYGLTPVTNRAACAFVRRVGFKEVGILPRGQRINGSECVDAMITIKERANGR